MTGVEWNQSDRDEDIHQNHSVAQKVHTHNSIILWKQMQ